MSEEQRHEVILITGVEFVKATAMTTEGVLPLLGMICQTNKGEMFILGMDPQLARLQAEGAIEFLDEHLT